MSTKRTTYSAEFKTKIVIEVLRNEKTLAEIASENNVTPKNIQNLEKDISRKRFDGYGAGKGD